MNGRIRKLLVGLIFSICIAGVALADLAGQISGIINQSSQKKVRYSIHIVKAKNGEEVYSHNANTAMIPASNMKLVVTAAGVKLLPNDFEYVTKVGLLDESLVIIGAGDPLLGYKDTDVEYGRRAGWVIEKIIKALRDKGVTRVKDIIVDTSVFDDERVHPSWDAKDLNRWYASEVSGLNYNGNCIEVTAVSGHGGVQLSIEPATSYVQIVNKCKATSKLPNTVWCSRPAGTNKITVRGKCYKECQPIRVTIDRPAGFFAFLLAEQLAKEAVISEGHFIEKQVEPGKKIKVITEFRTKLSDVLKECNKVSLQLAAESLLKTIAAYSNNDKKNGSWEQGRRVVSSYLASLGVKEKEFFIDDASGLSRENQLSANAITKVLLDIYNSKKWEYYKESLAVGGIDGTIDKYFNGEKYKGKIFGKTGYINRVKSFSGVCSTVEGDYIFAIIANNANGKSRDAINDIAKAIFDSE